LIKEATKHIFYYASLKNGCTLDLEELNEEAHLAHFQNPEMEVLNKDAVGFLEIWKVLNKEALPP